MFDTSGIKEASKALGFYATLNSVFGLWPLCEKNLLVKTLWFVSTVELATMVTTSLYEMYFAFKNANPSMDILVIINFSSVALAKAIFYYVHQDSLRKNVSSAIDDWSRPETIVIRSIRCSYRKIHQRMTKIYVAIGIAASFTYVLKVLYFDRNAVIRIDQPMEKTMLKRPFVFPSVYTFNEVSQSLYVLINVHQFFQLLVCVGVNLFSDSFFVTMTYHLCGEFEILKRRFSRFERVQSETQTRRKYGILVERYRHLLELTKYLEKSCNMIIFSQIVINIILFNTAGINFLIQLKRKEHYSAMSPLLILVFTLVQTFLYAQVGQNVSSVIEDITESIYEGGWRTMSLSMAKDVHLLMTLSHVSIHLTAGKLFKMRRSTFTQFVKTSVSYLSVFYALIED